jgi:hypothetical protein
LDVVSDLVLKQLSKTHIRILARHFRLDPGFFF